MSSIENNIWPRAIIASFVLLAAFNALLVYLALKSRTDLMDEHSYELGLTFENIIQEKNAAVRDGVSAELKLMEQEIVVVTHGLKSDRDWQVSLRLVRPDDSRIDRNLTVRGSGPDFKLPSSPLKSGLWMAQITVEDGPTRYYFEMKVVR